MILSWLSEKLFGKKNLEKKVGKVFILDSSGQYEVIAAYIDCEMLMCHPNGGYSSYSINLRSDGKINAAGYVSWFPAFGWSKEAIAKYYKPEKK
jgi:hypothetical protein